MRDDSIVERSWARVWGAPFVALVAGVIVAIIYFEWMKYDPPAQVRARAISECRQGYQAAATAAESTKIDLTIAIPLVAKSATRAGSSTR